VAEPVAAIARADLTELQTTARNLASRGSEVDDATAELTLRTDTTLARMREVLTRMLELESYNEVIEKLRGVIDSQEQIRADTLERQRRRAREALEAP
jgi:predicted RNase H-like nuclease (RuvC/YqgF family)